MLLKIDRWTVPKIVYFQESGVKAKSTEYHKAGIAKVIDQLHEDVVENDQKPRMTSVLLKQRTKNCCQICIHTKLRENFR